MTRQLFQHSLFIAIMSSITHPVMAQQTKPLAVTLPDTEVHAVHSSHVGDDFELWIAHPQAGFMRMQDEPLRVLYVLDANLFFGIAVEMTRIMHKLYGELPPLLVVGVAYPTDNGFLQGALRTRDFTPTEDAGMAAMASSFPQMPDIPKVEPAMGGADAFLQFLQTEVKPFVEDKFDVAKHNDIIFGSSLGGLFVTHALLESPESFSNYIAVSPALWWNNGKVFEKELSNTQNQSKVFFAAGSLEESPDIPGIAAFKLVSNAQKMAANIEALYPEQVFFQVIDGETHTSVVPVALTRGLRQLLRPATPGK